MGNDSQIISIESEISEDRRQFAIYFTSNQPLDIDDITSAIEAFLKQNTKEEPCTIN